MTFEMTHKEARALTAYLHLIRLRSGGPEWHKAGIEDALGRAKNLAPSGALATAAIKAALEPANRTPAVIGMEGPHWQGSTTPPRRPFDSNQTCGVCGFSEAECRRRWTGDHEFESVARAKARHETDETDVARVVQDLRERTADDPPVRPEPETTTAGTERVAPIRAQLAHPVPQPHGPNIAAGNAAGSEE